MEKRKAHFPLFQVKRLIREGSYRVTRTALVCGRRDFRLLGARQVAECILKLEANEFYKSMTTLYDSRTWQDVYHGTVRDTRAYIKVQIDEGETVVISFKRLEEF